MCKHHFCRNGPAAWAARLLSNFIDDEPKVALSIHWSPTRVSRFSESGHTERNAHPFRIEGVKAAARKQEVRIPEKIRVAAQMWVPKSELVKRGRPVLRSRRVPH